MKNLKNILDWVVTISEKLIKTNFTLTKWLLNIKNKVNGYISGIKLWTEKDAVFCDDNYSFRVENK